jgi:hypothetical protein
MKRKRTTQKLKVSPILKENILYIKNLKSNTVMSEKHKDAEFLFLEPFGFSVSIIAKKADKFFQVIELPESDHLITQLSGHKNISDEVKRAEAFVKEWLKSQRTN